MSGRIYRTAAGSNILHAIYPTVGTATQNKHSSRHDSILLSRLRIGQFRITHLYLLSGDDPPSCAFCGLPFTVKHMLLECPNLRDTVKSLWHWIAYNVLMWR